MIKVAIYSRVSTPLQKVDRQINELTKFSKQQNWEIINIFEEIVTGKRENREKINQILNLAKQKKINKLLVSEVSRISRKLRYTIEVIDELAKNKVSVYDYISKQETLDNTSSKSMYANIILPVFAGLAEQEATIISKRVKSGVRNAINQKGTWGRGLQKNKAIKNQKEIVKYLSEGFSIRKTSRICNVSDKTVQKVKKLI